MDSAGLDLSLTRNATPYGPSTVPQWQAIAVETNGAGGYDVLWERTNGDLAVWSVDSAGAYVSDTYYPVGSQTEDILEDLELAFGMELEGDAEIGRHR